jgi:AAA lid domain
VYVPEPTVDETYQILLGLRERYEAHHKLRYTDEALDAAAKYSHQYISDRCHSSVSCSAGLASVCMSHALHLEQALSLQPVSVAISGSAAAVNDATARSSCISCS